MPELPADILEFLRRASTATITTQLFKRGLRNTFLAGLRPLNPGCPAMVGEAFTLRYIPAREDLDVVEVFENPDHPQRRAVESVGPGQVLVMDTRGETRAASAGHILVTRMMRTWCPGARDRRQPARLPRMLQLWLPTARGEPATRRRGYRVLVGYVSDERYVALVDVVVGLELDRSTVAVVRSSPRGAIEADVPPGTYRVTLVKEGYGSKHVTVPIDPGRPHQFRLLSDRLVGYMWPRWVRSGQRAEFRVSSVEPYRLSLWRYGLQKELIRILGWLDEHGPRAVMQITPDGDYTQVGTNWNTIGYRELHRQLQSVVAPDRSGLYYVHAETETGEFFAFPWVVAPSSPRAPVAVLAGTNTWNAYNNFGGRSNYINARALPSQPTINARLDLLRYSDREFNEYAFDDAEYAPLSFERPEIGNHVPRDAEVTDPIRGRLACGMAPAEWRLLAWLEREGFPYDLYAEYQLHADELDLDAYRVLILPVHPEYWSRRMYERVKDWVHTRGGRLMYLAGNGLNCEVELPDERHMRVKTQLLLAPDGLTIADALDATRHYESRFHRNVESEAALLGVVYSDPGMMTGAPYRVLDDAHWVFAGTQLRNGDLFGEQSLHERCHGGASGHETDKMSQHSPAGTRLLAKGTNPDDGGADMVMYEVDGGGAVFSAGSITYVASLLVDEPLSRVTANVLDRFLLQTAHESAS